MYQRKDGDSSVQCGIEQTIFEKLKKLFCDDELISNPDLSVPGNPQVHIRPDFYSETKKIIGEIHVHLGGLKPAQKHKVASDILKLHLFDPEHQYKKYYVICSQQEYEQLRGNSFLAEAIRQFGITLQYIALDESDSSDLQNIMKKQNMFHELTLDELQEKSL